MRPLNHEEISAEFSSYLRAHHPAMPVVEVSSDAIVLDVAGQGQVSLMLHRLHRAIGRLDAATPHARQREYEDFLRMILPDNSVNMENIARAVDATERIYPKLVWSNFLGEVRRQTGDSNLAHRPFHETGLLLLYVLDFPDRVAYILRSIQDELGLNDAQLHEIAMQNARALFPRDDLRAVLAEPNALSVLECGDGHNSARLIVTSEYLEADEALAALLPDKNALLLTKAPADDAAWQHLSDLAVQLAATGDVPFLPRALRVTCDMVEVM